MGGGSRARVARGAGFRTRLNIAYGCGHKLRERPAERCVFYFFPEIIHSYITIKWQRIVFLRFSGVFRIFYRNGWGGWICICSESHKLEEGPVLLTLTRFS